MATSLRRFVGKVPLERALRMKMTRHGNLVKTQSISEEAKRSKKARRFINETIGKIEAEIEKREKTKGKRWLEVSKRKANILYALRESGIRKIHVTELCAALAFAYGLKKETLLPHANAAYQLIMGSRIPVEGNMTSYLSAIKKNLPYRINEILKDITQPLNSAQIAGKIGYGVNELDQKERSKRLIFITNSLGLLELMGLVQKLPKVLGERATGTYLWIASEHRLKPETKPETNIAFRIMERLYQRPHTLKEMATERVSFGKKYGSVEGVAEAATIVQQLSNLIEAEIVSKRRIVKMKGIPRIEYRLTDFGKELIDKQSRRKSITPNMRLALLGEFDRGRLRKEYLPYQRFKQYVNIIMDYYKTGSSLKIGAKYNIAHTTVLDYAKGKITNYKDLKTIRTKWLPLLKQEDPALAKAFEYVWLHPQEEKERAKKTK